MERTKKEPSIDTKLVDTIYLNMSKALNTFVRRNNLKFEEVDIILHRMESEWDQKKMQMFFMYLSDTHRKPPKDPSFIR